MDAKLEDYYVELTTRLRSVEAFCEFLSHGGIVRVADKDGASFIEVTKIMLARQRQEADAIRKTRRTLYPERADDKFPPSRSRH
ncbi:hypothetical protein [Rhizobium sp. AN80A]|jgi:hypothetical protein|uniref:hypothetical protein n=1 Tax=Rhizobium sp. AN80A TaxID=3040673 RepID=UPI000DD6CA85|nr:hypothetical protein [Rhizobium sp. AN80A]